MFGSSISRRSARSSDWPCLMASPLGPFHAWSLRFQLALLSRTTRMFGAVALDVSGLVNRSMSSAAAGGVTNMELAKRTATSLRREERLTIGTPSDLFGYQGQEWAMSSARTRTPTPWVTE